VYPLSIMQEEVSKCKKKEQELLRLLQVKAEKYANNRLTKKRHTQLSYLTKEEQEFEVAIPKGVILDKLISDLKKI